ncbi:hypothetical protein ATEIFO6365_0005034800 [Aspergillus terreus]|uniref:Uncharacterized protein n=1 Tax=Aspergillus terreus TaxID=33178 RepID=A0A5M3Z596_ASPTE|nr:hypothetical protein ATETN484_0007035300 [Aspergillus terreus]GFF16158.1 hypothetical protein ATEIFO6365_0005034800 [Aspergillus terreus]
MARAAVIPATSPPKRGARTTKRTTAKTTTTASRSATSGVTKQAPRTRTATASTVASQAKRGVRSTPKPTNDDNTDNETDDEIGVIEQQKPKTTISKPRGRPPTKTYSTGTSRGRKVTATAVAADTDDSEEDELAQAEKAPKKQAGRPKKQIPKEEEAPKPESAPRPRGRPKGSTNKTTKAATAEKESSSRTRPRAGTDVNSAGGPKEVFITTNSTMMKSNLLRGPAKKKKVTFQDLSDSEDMLEPSPPAGRKRATVSGRQTGLAAKPARKTATTSARGRKPAATKKTASKPLSPKKATQVAKSLSSYVSSDGEDDELSGAKSPIKLVVHSPQKHGSETTGLSSPVKKINFTTAQSPKNVDENGKLVSRPRRSIDFNDTAFMSSPARRPTPSPFNYTIRETPRRAGFAFRDDTKPTAQPNFTPMQESPLKLSPKKANLGTPRLGGLSVPHDQPLSQPNFTPGQNSPLKSSPKKGLFGSSFISQALPQESSTPFKSRSLLMSPAKKIASPFKSSIFGKSCSLPESPQSVQNGQELDASNLEPAHETPLRGAEQDEETEANDDTNVQNAIDRDPEDVEADYPSGDESHEHDLIVAADMGADQPPPDLQDDQPEHLEEAGTEGDMAPIDEPEPASIDHHDISHDDPETEPGNKEGSGFEQLELIEQLDNKDEGDLQEPMDVVEEETAPLEHDASGEDAEKLAKSEGHFETTEAINELPSDGISDNGEEDHEHDEAMTDIQAAPAVQEHAEPFQNESSHILDEEKPNDLGNSPDFEANTPPGSPLNQNMTEGLEDPFTDGYLATETRVIAQEVEDDEETAPAVDGGCDDKRTEEDCTTTSNTSHGESLLVFDATDHDASQPQALTPYEIDERRDSIASQKLQHYLPSAPSPPKKTEFPGFPEYRDPEDHIESIMEDTVSVAEPTTELSIHTEKEPTPLTESQLPQHPERRRSSGPRFTLLAEQLSGWKASSPEKSEKARPRKRGVFSLAGNLKRPSDAFSITSDVAYPALSLEEPLLSINSQEIQVKDEGPTIFEDEHAEPGTIEDDIQENSELTRPPLFEIFSDAQADASEGGMEHTPAASSKGNRPVCSPPSVHEPTLEEEKENQNSLLPAPATPAKNVSNQMHTFHTVSKVPLKPEGQISPLKMPRKRGRSLSMASPLRSSPRIRNIIASREQNPSASPSPRPQRLATPQLKSPNSSRVRRSISRHSGISKAASRSPSPYKTPGRNTSACNQVLRGAVVYVDVHTTEGEDASGIFVELLSQMGARCVKNWAWNPRASLCPQDEQEPKDGRIGITHVVYKDGGVRTLEKVRQAGGVVKCVGVGWVLDCERANKWLDESHYAVDSSIIPRGGAKRRKSMEPRALSNVNGTLVKSTTASSGSGRRSGADWDSMEDFMRHTPPLREESTSSSATPESSKMFRLGHPEADQEYCQTPKTPGSSAYDFANLDRIGMSPATPFYLSQRSRLVQQTCPPKQTRQGLFSTPRQTAESSNPLRARLEAARRQSLAFKPRVGSPLIE